MASTNSPKQGHNEQSQTISLNGDAAELVFREAIPGYEVLGELGRGGMGVVYKAQQKSLKRLVALKMIRGGDRADAQDLARFQAEAEALARLRHPHIVQIHEVGQHQGQPYFSLEFLEGGSLSRKLGGNPLPAREAAELVEKLAKGVHAAHQTGILHRDLKPANVLLTCDGEPKISDFGLAKQLDLDTGQTRTGAIMGTPSYMAPEQASGETKQAGPAADIWSLGIMLYEFLTGRPPFKGATAMDTLLQVTNDEPVPPTRLQPKVPRDLETICLKCLHKDPANRYASAHALAADVRRFLDGLPIEARPVGWRERTAKWAKRRPALAALIVVSSLASIALLAGGVYFTEELRDERDKFKTENIEANKQRDRARKGEEAATLAKRKAEEATTEAIEQKNIAAKREDEANRERKKAEKAKIEEELARKDAEQQKDRLQQSLFSAQLFRVAGLWQSDPLQGAKLLRDLQACPPNLRDFAWRFHDRLCHSERGFFPLDSYPFSGVVSDDGKLLAAGTVDGSVHLWDMQTQKLLHIFWHRRDVLAGTSSGDLRTVAVFSKDSKTLISGSFDKTIRVWDVQSGKEAKTIEGMSGIVTGLVLHPDGIHLAASSYQTNPTGNANLDRIHKGEVILWNLQSGQKKTVFMHDSPGAAYCLAMSRDGKLLAVGFNAGLGITLWEIDTGKEYASFGAHTGWTQGLAFSNDGMYLVSGSSNHLITLWDVAGKKELFQLFGHTSEVETVSWSKDDKLLVSTGSDQVVRVWNVGTRKELLAFPGHRPFIATFTPDGKGVICAEPGGLRHLALPQAPEALSLRQGTGILALVYSPDSKHLAYLNKNGEAQLLDPRSGAGQSMARGTRCLAFSPDSRRVFLGVTAKDSAGKETSSVASWNIDAKKSGDTLVADAGPIGALAVSAPLHWLASGSADGVLKWWSLKDNRALGVLPLGNTIRALVFHPTDKLLAAAIDGDTLLIDFSQAPPKVKRSGKTSARIGFTPDGAYLAGVQGTQVSLTPIVGGAPGSVGPVSSKILSMALCPDRRTIALGVDRHIELWDYHTNQLRAVLSTHTREVGTLAFSPDGQRLASGTFDFANFWWVNFGEIKIWSAEPISPIEPIFNLTFSTDGRKLVATARDQTMIVWNSLTGGEGDRFQPPFPGQPSRFNFLSADGGRLISLSFDHQVRLADSKTGKQLASWKTPVPIAARFTLPGDPPTLVIATTDQALHFRNLQTLEKARSVNVPGLLRIGQMDVSRDQKWFAQAEKGKIRVRSLVNNEAFELGEESQVVRAVKFVPGDRLLSISPGEKRFTVWDLKTRQARRPALEHSTVLSLLHALSPDGKTLATVSARWDTEFKKPAAPPQWEIRTWNLETLAERKPPIFLPNEGPTHIAITADNELIVARPERNLVKFVARIKLNK